MLPVIEQDCCLLPLERQTLLLCQTHGPKSHIPLVVVVPAQEVYHCVIQRVQCVILLAESRVLQGCRLAVVGLHPCRNFLVQQIFPYFKVNVWEVECWVTVNHIETVDHVPRGTADAREPGLIKDWPTKSCTLSHGLLDKLVASRSY